MYILAEKVDQYHNDEETLKTALLNAQRMGESVIHEARQKAETILYDATNKANQARDEALEKVAEEELLLSRLKAEVAHFKSDILNLYKQHIESLSLLPGEEKKKPNSQKNEEEPAVEEKAETAQQQEEKSAEDSLFDSIELEGGTAPMEDYQGISFED